MSYPRTNHRIAGKTGTPRNQSPVGFVTAHRDRANHRSRKGGALGGREAFLRPYAGGIREIAESIDGETNGEREKEGTGRERERGRQRGRGKARAPARPFRGPWNSLALVSTSVGTTGDARVWLHPGAPRYRRLPGEKGDQDGGREGARWMVGK